jgi:hypothetical protein
VSVICVEPAETRAALVVLCVDPPEEPRMEETMTNIKPDIIAEYV